MSDVATPYILPYWMVTADWTPWSFFVIDAVSGQGFFDGVLSSEESFGRLIARFCFVWICFCHVFFLQTIENKAAKHGGAFGLIKLSAFPMCLRPRNKVAFWSVLIQAPLD